MFGIRQPLDGPIFTTLNDAENWCMDVMADHYDRRFGLSDARIEPFQGMVDCGKPPDPAMLRDIAGICERVPMTRRLNLGISRLGSLILPACGLLLLAGCSDPQADLRARICTLV
jgi:hypothetical protein